MVPGSCPTPQYPLEARRYELQGRVELSVLVDTDGKPIDVRLAKSSGWPILDKAVMQGYRCRFVSTSGALLPHPIWIKTGYVWRIDDNDGNPSKAPPLVYCLPSTKIMLADDKRIDRTVQVLFGIHNDGTPYAFKIAKSSNNLDIDSAAVEFVAGCKYKYEGSGEASHLTLTWDDAAFGLAPQQTPAAP
jgi:TonB family protein